MILLNKTPNRRATAAVLVGTALTFSLLSVTARATSLYSEPFDSEATAKVLVQKLANADLAWVDYSSFVRDQPGGGGPVTLRIPEAPNRIPGSAASRGVLLNATYAANARTIHLLAAATPGGAAATFSGNYRMAFDVWMAMDPTATTGTTEAALFGIGQGAVIPGLVTRTTGVGTYGWLSTEGGVGSAGDMSLFVNGTAAFTTDLPGAPPDPQTFISAFPGADPIGSNAANNQWSQVELFVNGTTVTVLVNGVKFGESTAAATSGFASIGYQDPFTPSIPGGFNRQFAIFDNFTIDSIPGPAALSVEPTLPFAPVRNAEDAPVSDYMLTNSHPTATYEVTSAVIDGVNAADFTVTTTLPITLQPQFSEIFSVALNASVPNGLKLARLTLNTTDPNQPVIRLPLQARRLVNTIEAGVSLRIASVSAVGGTGAGEVTLTNNSAAAVTVSAPSFTGSNPTMFSIPGNLFPLEIPASSSSILPVTFTPGTTTAGLKSATAEFATTDAGVPVLSVLLRSRYAFGPPLLAHYKMDETSGTSLADSAATSPAASLEIREAPFGFSRPSLLPNDSGTAIGLLPADSSTTGNFAISNAAHLPDVSYSLWIRPEAKAGGNRRILNRSSLFTVSGTIYSLYLTPTGKLVFEVNSQTSVESAEGAIEDGTAYHVAVTHRDADGFGNNTGTPSGTRTRLFINGQMIAENSTDPVPGFTDYTLTSTSQGLYIGTATSAGQGYIGELDDLQIYNGELDPDQIAGIYSQPGKTAFNLEVQDYRITNVAYSPDQSSVTLTWNAAPGAVYSIQQSTSTSGFTDVAGQTGITSNGVILTRTFTVPAGPIRFFQVRRTSP